MRKRYDTRIEGLGSLQAGTYSTILVEGSGKFKGDITFEECNVQGMAKAMNGLYGDLLKIDGTCKVMGNIKVKELLVRGLLRTDETTIYADKIKVEGMLKNGKEVSADIIHVEGFVNTPALVGDEIYLNYSESLAYIGFGAKLIGLRDKLQGVDTIECTKLEASYLRCKRISAETIRLCDHCHVDHIECDGDLYMDTTCTCDRITGNYRLHR